MYELTVGTIKSTGMTLSALNDYLMFVKRLEVNRLTNF